MRKNFGAKPWTYPQPVFILATYGEDGTPDAMNAAWGGISGSTELSMCISAGHKTTASPARPLRSAWPPRSRPWPATMWALSRAIT